MGIEIQPGIIGLVACGGKSSRMGTDKSLLDYHGQPQRYYIFQSLVPFCAHVFLSLNRQQSDDEFYPVILDDEKYAESGPIAALLSAWSKFPESRILLVGCDYPLLRFSDIESLINIYRQANTSAAFYDSDAGKYEPVIGLYHPNDRDVLLKLFESSNYSLQYFLNEINAGKFFPVDKESIRSIDHGEDMQALKDRLNSL